MSVGSFRARIVGFGAGCAAIFFATATYALDLEISAQVKPQVINELTSPPQQLDGQPSADGWIYRVNFGPEIIIPLKINVSQIPAGYDYEPFDLAAPFFVKDGTIKVVLTPASKTQVDPGMIRQIFGTDVTGMSDDELPVFYQQARVVATYRMNLQAGNWAALHPYDIQSVFKFLEAVVQLSKRIYVIPPQDVERARDWMADAISHNPDRFSNAGRGMSLVNARKVVSDVDDSEGIQFTKLWQEIENINDCSTQLPLYQSYKLLMRRVPIGHRFDTLVSVTKVPLPTVDSTIAQCVASNVKGGSLKGASAEAALKTQIQNLQATRLTNAAKSVAVQRKLHSDIVTLQNILRSKF